MEAEKDKRTPEDIATIIQKGREPVIWHIAYSLQAHRISKQRGVLSQTENDWNRNVRQLVTRALSDADAEGVTWTPVLDALAGSSAWPSEATKGLPSPADRVEGLAPWLRMTDDRKAVQSLLTFRYPGIFAQVLEHCQVLTTEEMFRLVQTPHLVRRLRLNPRHGRAEDEKLIRHCYDHWLAEVQSSQRTKYHQTKIFPVFAALIEDGCSLPEDLRRDLIQHTRTRGPISQGPFEAARLLVRYRLCPEDVLRSVYQWGGEVKALVAGHPNCPREIFLDIVKNNGDAVEHLLRLRQLPEAMLKEIEGHWSHNAWIAAYRDAA